MESGVINMAFTTDTFTTNIKFIYKCFSEQDKADLGNFTTDYSRSFGNIKLGLREQWWHIDLIYVGRWTIFHNTIDAEELVGTDFWDNGVLPDKHYHEFMFELVLPGKWK